MGRAIVLTSASKANITGGTFADNLSANSGDSLSVANFENGGAKMLEAWGNDSTSVAEVEFIYTRPKSTHDQSHGFRAQIASKLAGSAGKVGAQEFLPGNVVINLFKSDTPTISVTGTAADNVLVSWNTLYDDLPGAAGTFISPSQAASMQVSTLGIFVNAAGSGTAGAYGTSRAFNADDARLHANTWYAIIGYTMQVPVTTVSLLGPDWGGQRIGGPGDPLTFRTASWFLDQSTKWGLPLVPCFNSNNVGNVLVSIADANASTTPTLDFVLYELSGTPQGGS